MREAGRINIFHSNCHKCLQWRTSMRLALPLVICSNSQYAQNETFQLQQFLKFLSLVPTCNVIYCEIVFLIGIWCGIWNKLFKNRLSKIHGRQLLKTLNYCLKCLHVFNSRTLTSWDFSEKFYQLQMSPQLCHKTHRARYL